MENTPLILSIATFIVTLLVYFAVASVVSAQRKDRNLIKRTEKWSEATNNADGKRDLKREGMLSFLRLPGDNKNNPNNSIYSDTPLFYQRAGIYNPDTIRSYRILRFILALTPFIILTVSHFVYRRPFNRMEFLTAFILGFAGYFLPVLWLKIVAHYRKQELNKTFPDAMDLLMVCVEAGLGIDSAIRRVSQEIYITSPELAKELRILSLELKTGKSRNDCLKNLARRTDLSDVNNLVSLLIQADKYGTGVANALKVHAEEMRQKRYSRLEELAAKLPVKLVVPLILFIFPAFFVVIMGPAFIQVFRVVIQR